MKKHRLDGMKVQTANKQRFEVWEPRWWQLGRWFHWWKFRRYHGFVSIVVPTSDGSCVLKVRVVPAVGGES